MSEPSIRVDIRIGDWDKPMFNVRGMLKQEQVHKITGLILDCIMENEALTDGKEVKP